MTLIFGVLAGTVMKLEVLKSKVRSGEIKAIAFDTTVFDYSGQRFKSGILQQLGQFKDTQTSLLISEITKEEMISHLADRISRIQNTLSNGFREAKEYLILEDSKVASLVQNINPRSIALSQFSEFMTDTSLKVIPAQGNVPLDDVICRYFNSKPPFSKGKKKNEFPDAIALISLESWAAKYQSEIIVVSQDSDWKDFCEASTWLICKSNLGEVLGLFQLEDSNEICQNLSDRYRMGDLSDLDQDFYNSLEAKIHDLDYDPDEFRAFSYSRTIRDISFESLHLEGLKGSDYIFRPVNSKGDSLAVECHGIVQASVECEFTFHSWTASGHKPTSIATSNVNFSVELETDFIIIFVGKPSQVGAIPRIKNINVGFVYDRISYEDIMPDWIF
jgi:hypothetical protein